VGCIGGRHQRARGISSPAAAGSIEHGDHPDRQRHLAILVVSDTFTSVASTERGAVRPDLRRAGCRRGLGFINRGRDSVDVQDAGEREAAEAAPMIVT
jgi:hypothetical protein